MIFNIKLHEFSFYFLKIRHEHRQALFLHLSELGSHQLVKLGIAWELVDKRYKGAADLYEEEPYINKDEEPDIAEDDETQDEE